MSDAVLPEDLPESGYSSAVLSNLLGISGANSEEEQIRVLLWQLDQADYLPPPVWHEAIAIVTGREQIDWETADVSFPALREESEEKLRLEIEDFVTRFAALVPRERRAEWNELLRRSQAWPQFAKRLRLLEPGLEFALPIAGLDEATHIDRLLQCIAQLFPLDVLARHRLIGELLQPMRGDPHQWRSAVFELGRTHPQAVNLVPEFVLAVTQLRTREERYYERRGSRRLTVAEEPDPEKPDPKEPRRSQVKPLTLSRLQFWGEHSYFWVVAVFFGIPLLLVLAALICEYAIPNSRFEGRAKSRTAQTSAEGEPRNDEVDAREEDNPITVEGRRK
jgi:hypothetical protein